jgi:DNA-binding MarR family transcriptional regulator
MSAKLKPSLPCMCASLRRAARAVTQKYDEALRPLGLTSTQFTLLQALKLTREITQGALGEALAMDSTTLTRTLAIMRRHGWVASRRGTDRREHRLQLSARGAAQYGRAAPHWERAQSALRTRLGGERWEQLMHMLNKAAGAAAE